MITVLFSMLCTIVRYLMSGGYKRSETISGPEYPSRLPGRRISNKGTFLAVHKMSETKRYVSFHIFIRSSQLTT
jgi:hypothetical protein